MLDSGAARTAAARAGGKTAGGAMFLFMGTFTPYFQQVFLFGVEHFAEDLCNYVGMQPLFEQRKTALVQLHIPRVAREGCLLVCR